MQPWRHAKITARSHGTTWQDDLDIHEFIDMAKIACPDLRHRIVLHNSDLGVRLTEKAFPNRADCEPIVRDHVWQDLKTVPSLQQWVATAHAPVLPRWHQPNDDEIVASACEKIGLIDEAPVRNVLNLLTLATAYLPGQEDFARALLMNSLGPPLVRRIMGPARVIDQETRSEIVFDPSWVAEGIIVANFGRIAPLGDVLAPFSGQYPK